MKNKIIFFAFLITFGSTSIFAYRPTREEFQRDMRAAYQKWIAPAFRRDNRFSRIEDAPPLVVEGAAASRNPSVLPVTTTLRAVPSLMGEPKTKSNAAVTEHLKSSEVFLEGAAASGSGSEYLGRSEVPLGAAAACGAAPIFKSRKEIEEEDAAFAAALAAAEEVEEEVMPCSAASACTAAPAYASSIPASLLGEIKKQFDVLDTIINRIKNNVPEALPLNEALEILKQIEGEGSINVAILRDIPRARIGMIMHIEKRTLDKSERKMFTKGTLATPIRDLFKMWKRLKDIENPSLGTEDLG